MPRSRSPRVLPVLCLAGAVLFWGTSFVATKTAQRDFPPMTVMWLRMIVASAVFLPFWRRVPRPVRHAGDGRFLVVAVLCIPCLYYLFEGYAVRYTTSSQAGVVSAIMPLMVAVGAWAFLRERVGWQSGMALAASLAGVAILSSAGVAQRSAPDPVLGNLLELAAMVAATGSTLTVKHLSERYDPWFLTGLQVAVGVAFFAPFAFMAGGDWRSASPAAWFSVGYLGLFASLAAFGLYNTALKRMPATRAALAINLIPAVAMLAGWALLGESLTPLQLAACALIVGAVVFAELSGRVPAGGPAAP
jgi:drug/metabolite transporter (DMT)-like permease